MLSFMTNYEPDLSLIFQALSDPTRRAVLARLGQGSVAVTDLARPTGWALPTVMRHLAVLEQAGLIGSEKWGRSRICSLRPETIDATAGWLSDLRAGWESQTDRLELYVKTLMKEKPDDN